MPLGLAQNVLECCEGSGWGELKEAILWLDQEVCCFLPGFDLDSPGWQPRVRVSFTSRASVHPGHLYLFITVPFFSFECEKSCQFRHQLCFKNPRHSAFSFEGRPCARQQGGAGGCLSVLFPRSQTIGKSSTWERT